MFLATVGTSHGQPIITNQPQNQTSVVGATATFTVGVTGTEPLAYQWQKSLDQTTFTDRLGDTAPTLIITSVQAADQAYYRVVVTNLEGAVTSSAAYLGVLVPPSISSGGQPTNFPSASLGATVGNRVVASGSPPLSYQWRFNGTNLPGQIGASIFLSDLKAAATGDYTVVVTNLGGSVTSQVARLEVDLLFTKQARGVPSNDNFDGRGAAWGDYDDDGDLDLAVVGGMWWDYESANSVVYTNRGGGAFSLRGTLSSTPPSRAETCNWIDIDNDGDLDLWIGAYESQRPLFWTNQGGGNLKLMMVNTNWVKSPFEPRGALQCWTDFDRDGFVDLALVPLEYTDVIQNPIQLLRNMGDGTLQASTNSLPVSIRKYSSSASWVDYDGDGDFDLMCPGGSPTVFRNDEGVLMPELEAEALGLLLANAGMDAWADFDNDGDLDVLVTAGWWGSHLLRNEGGGKFSALAGQEFAALQRAHANFAAWGDYDNDGDLDVMLTYGEYDVANRNQLFRNDGSQGFAEVLSGSPVVDRAQSTVPTWVDFDGDGDLDLFVVNADNGSRTSWSDFLYRNNGGSNKWFEVKLVGRLSNRSAIGAKVHVKATIGGHAVWQLRTISADAFSQSLVAHFGLGNASLIDVLRVEWPSGVAEEWTTVAVNQIAVLEEAVLAAIASVPEASPGIVAIPKGSPVRLSISTWLPGASYEWLRNGQRIPGATALSLDVPNFSVADIGEYAALVTSGSIKVTCRPVRLEMEGRPVLVGPFASPGDSVSAGENLELSVHVTAAEPYSCQWQRDGIDISPGANATATNRTLQIMDAKPADSGDYRLTVRNAIDSVTSAGLPLRVDGTFTKLVSGPAVTDSQPGVGVSWWDYDGDGWDDLIVANSSWNGLTRNALYHNDGLGGFTRATNAVSTMLLRSYNTLPADFDNDGNLDLFTVNPDATVDNCLFRNLGGGEFVRLSPRQAGAIVDDNASTMDGVWLDYDADGWLDFFVSNSDVNDFLYRGQPNGMFIKQSPSQVGDLYKLRGNQSFIACADYDNDGYPDLWVTGWPTNNALYHNEADGSFVRKSPPGMDEDAGGAAAWVDYDNDGLLDLFVASDGWVNSLYRNLGQGSFTNVAAVAGLRTALNTWTSTWGDYDNDGYLDAYLVNWERDNRLYHNNGDGTFTSVDVGSPVHDGKRDVMARWGDYNNDGFLDLAVACGNALKSQLLLYRGNSNGNHWLTIKLHGTKSNRNGIGAKVKVQATIRGRSVTQVREISSDGFAGSPILMAHFGLGDALKADQVWIQWPSGFLQEIKDVAADQLRTIQELPVLSAQLREDGGLFLEVQSDPSQRCRLEGSPDLRQWTLVTVLPGGGTFEPDPLPGPTQFYRVVLE